MPSHWAALQRGTRKPTPLGLLHSPGYRSAWQLWWRPLWGARPCALFSGPWCGCRSSPGLAELLLLLSPWRLCVSPTGSSRLLCDQQHHSRAPALGRSCVTAAALARDRPSCLAQSSVRGWAQGSSVAFAFL